MTQLDNVNRALAEIGTRSRLTVVDGSTTEGLYASLLYPMLRDAMLRMGDYDWAMTEIGPTPNAVMPEFWNFAYEYPVPTICVRIRQAVPARPDRFDPVPMEWNILGTGLAKIVVSNVPISLFLITRNDCPESTWDAQFTDSFIRYFASAMTMALENRLEASEMVLKEALTFAGMANTRMG